MTLVNMTLLGIAAVTIICAFLPPNDPDLCRPNKTERLGSCDFHTNPCKSQQATLTLELIF